MRYLKADLKNLSFYYVVYTNDDRNILAVQ